MKPGPRLLKYLLNLQPILEFPAICGEKLGLIMPRSGWDSVKTNVIKNYEVGIEVKWNLPRFDGISEIEKLAREAVKLALQHYGDMLLDVDIKVKYGNLPDEKELRIGYQVDLHQERDFTKFIQMDINYDKQKNSYMIIAIVYRHIIDAIPVVLLIYLLHNHLVLKKNSYLNNCERIPDFSLREKFSRFRIKGTVEKWKEVMPDDRDIFLSVGSRIDISKSNLYKLRRKIAKDVGMFVTSSSVELALLAIDMELNYASDCVAQGQINRRGRLDVQKGYNGLGFVHTKGYADIGKLNLNQQYSWLCNKLVESSKEMILEKDGKGKASILINRLGRIPDMHRRFFDKCANYDLIMDVSSSQILSSNLNGIYYGVPICIGNITPENIRFLGAPACPEHDSKIIEQRQSQGLKTEITEISFVCGEKIKNSCFVDKAIKTSKNVAIRILTRWGHDVNLLEGMTKIELVKKLFQETFRPDFPLEGRLEKLAGEFLNCEKL